VVWVATRGRWVRARRFFYMVRRGAVSSKSRKRSCQNLAKAVVRWPRVSWLAGMRKRRAFAIRFSSRSMIPVSGGLRSSSAELIASTVARTRSNPGEGL
jgi:uncharacterized protein involved in propanediol utilization